MFVVESINNLFKPKSRKEIKSKLKSLDVDSKENMLKDLMYDESYFDYPIEAIEFIEGYLSEEDLDRVWDTIIDLVDESEYVEIYGFGGSNEKIDKEWVLTNMRYHDILDLMITSLSEDNLDLILDSLNVNESIENLLKPKTEEEINKIFGDLIGESPENLLNLLNKNNIMNINKILSPKDPKKIIESIINEGSIDDKYTILIALFDEDFDKIGEEFNDRGIDSEDLIDSYINFWGDFRSTTKKPGKIDWILSDILRDHIDEISEKVLKKAFE